MSKTVLPTQSLGAMMLDRVGVLRPGYIWQKSVEIELKTQLSEANCEPVMPKHEKLLDASQRV
ncbi:MAG: hypothetical protein P8N63_16900 [Pseudomonadales bacterium]|nr:hypothetical protein [Pseudomonadales bacterium]